MVSSYDDFDKTFGYISVVGKWAVFWCNLQTLSAGV